MELSLATARSGKPCLKAGDRWLHSAYDPEKEAARFLEGMLDGRKPSTFLLLGSCLDYLGELLASRFPGALILRIDFDPRIEALPRRAEADSWTPASPESLGSFLRSRLDETKAAGIAVIEWPPAIQAFPIEAEAAREAVRKALARLSGSAATLRSSGRQWIANACRNFLLVQNLVRMDAGNVPVVVAAAGPSLNEALEILRPFRESFFLLAVSSALSACVAEGLEPELVIATDGGNWSRPHLYPLSGKCLPLAAPLSALPTASLSETTALLLIEQGNFPESELASNLGPCLRLPSHGTVSGSALQLAAALTRGPIVAAGLDLASLDVLSHAKPHGFDFVMRQGESRTRSLEGSVWARESAAAPFRVEGSGSWRHSRSLSVYADALSSDALSPSLRGRLHRLLPSPVDLPGFEPITETGLRGLLGASEAVMPRLSEKPAPSEGREESLRGFFSAWRRRAEDAAARLALGQTDLDEMARELLLAVDLPAWARVARALAAGEDAAQASLALRDSVLAFLDGLERKLLR